MTSSRTLNFITIHPKFLEEYTQFGVFKSAIEQGLLRVNIIDLRKFAIDHRGSIDERPYGGGDGMVMRPEPLAAALATIDKPYQVIHFAPQGKAWTHADAVQFSLDFGNLAIICGRFAGVDQRFLDRYVDLTISIGQFVVSGGELPALLVSDSILRQIPGVLGDPQSAAMDSFGAGLNGRIEGPLYTKPFEFEGMKVPEVLLSGDHRKIAEWRLEQSIAATKRYEKS